MTEIDMHEAETQSSTLVDRVLQGEEIVIARSGKPLVRLVPDEGETALRPIGLDRRTVDQAFLEESMRPVEDDALSAFYASNPPGG